MKSTAAVWPPASDPQNNQLFAPANQTENSVKSYKSAQMFTSTHIVPTGKQLVKRKISISSKRSAVHPICPNNHLILGGTNLLVRRHATQLPHDRRAALSTHIPHF